MVEAVPARSVPDYDPPSVAFPIERTGRGNGVKIVPLFASRCALAGSSATTATGCRDRPVRERSGLVSRPVPQHPVAPGLDPGRRPGAGGGPHCQPETIGGSHEGQEKGEGAKREEEEEEAEAEEGGRRAHRNCRSRGGRGEQAKEGREKEEEK